MEFISDMINSIKMAGEGVEVYLNRTMEPAMDQWCEILDASSWKILESGGVLRNLKENCTKTKNT